MRELENYLCKAKKESNTSQDFQGFIWMLKKLFSTHLAWGNPALADLGYIQRICMEDAELLSCPIPIPLVNGPRNYLLVLDQYPMKSHWINSLASIHPPSHQHTALIIQESSYWEAIPFKLKSANLGTVLTQFSYPHLFPTNSLQCRKHNLVDTGLWGWISHNNQNFFPVHPVSCCSGPTKKHWWHLSGGYIGRGKWFDAANLKNPPTSWSQFKCLIFPIPANRLNIHQKNK